MFTETRGMYGDTGARAAVGPVVVGGSNEMRKSSWEGEASQREWIPGLEGSWQHPAGGRYGE